MKKLIIVDGYSLLFRAYFATSFGGTDTIMRTKSGIPTNAIFAFSNMINKIISNFKENEGLFVGFDAKGPTFRNEKYEKYKANRNPTPQELIIQMPIVRELLDSLDIKRYELENFEGDDICGTVAKKASKEGYKVLIYTSDRDYLQLVDENISLNIIRKGLSDLVYVDSSNIVNLFGFTPEQLIDFKGLRGDTSDNLPGIPGVGEKTAVKLLTDYKTLENIIANADNIGGKLGNNIKTYQNQGRDCRFLATIKTDIPLPFQITDCEYSGFKFDKINTFCKKYELKALLNRLPEKLKKGASINYDVQFVRDIENINGDEISLYLENIELNYHNSQISALCICDKSKAFLIKGEDIKNATKLKEILENENIKKYTYDSKQCIVSLKKVGIEIKGLEFDLLLASYLLDSSLKNNIVSILNYFNVDVSRSEEVLSLFNQDSIDKKFFSSIAYNILNIKDSVINELKQINVYDLYSKIELPLSLVLADMEFEGVPLSAVELIKIGEPFKDKLFALTKEIYQIVGHEFNISSPKQVSDVLFNELHLTTPKGNGSTSADILYSLINQHPVVYKILEYRKYAKLITTYVDALVSKVHPDGKIHTIFNQAETSTGRLSSSEPNLQNISTRDNEGRLIKKAFHYPDYRYKILSLDYSQIELRVLAALSNSQSLINVFNEGKDIHEATARKIFKIEGDVDPNLRRKAKAVNFGIVYGISDYGLSEEIGTSVSEAQGIINNFYNAFPEIKIYLDNIVNKASIDGYVTTYYGRRRYIREFQSQDRNAREFSKRTAMNAPIQGTAADIIKIAMINVDKLIKLKNYKSKLILQIHDELIFKVYQEEEESLIKDVKSAMENINFPIKLEVSLGLGKDWYEAK